jgi:RND family efflux transporter MFP subunit
MTRGIQVRMPMPSPVTSLLSLTLGSLAGLVSLGGLVSCHEASAQDAPAAPAAAPVSVARPVTASATEWDELTGHAQAKESVEIRARVSGYLQKVTFTEGALVKKGDLLYVIDSRPYDAELQRAQAALAQAGANVGFADRDAERNRQLLASGAIATRTYDNAKSTFDQLTAATSVSRAAVATAQLNVEYSRLYAPISGRVGRTHVTPGNLVTADAPEALTSLVSVDPIYVYVDVDEGRALRIQSAAQPGARPMPAYIGFADDEGYPHEAYLDFTENHAEEGTGTVQVRAVLPNPTGHWTPGLFARVRLPAGLAHDAVLVNDRAVGTDQDRKFVYVVGEGDKVEYRAVSLGPIQDGLRIVRSGLTGSDRVVVNGLQRVRPGAKVAPHEVPMKTPPKTEGDGGAP